MNTISPNRTFTLAATALLTIGIILISIFSLKNGYIDIFPYFYIVPILLMAWSYPRYAVYFTVGLGWVFLLLTWLYGPADIRHYAAGVAFFYVFVSLGIVVSALSGQALQDRKYREIVQNSQAGILTFDRQSQQVLMANAMAAAILGFPPDDLLRRKVSDLWLDELQETRFMEALVHDGKITDMEIALRRHDREIIWVLVTASVSNEDIIICSLVEISSSKRVRDELIESELRYRTLFDGASDAIFLHDLDGRIFEANVIATRYLGYSKKEFMQMNIRDFDTHPDDLFNSEILRQFQARGHILFRTGQKRKDGSIIPVEFSSRITEYFGMPAVMSTVRDLSEPECGMPSAQ
ncbi:MAG: PAS domain S-box protein [Methanomicrobiales archaeon]|nr:PAS domain S-box protein [Methanomicrobiales archaeon]